ncbi:heterokaryon incompatibility protein-domain-containing protein [Nemania abortiva]|nr:heterokaryon incompatibility protein-domain-containing protein [Nemania abortiva]
MSPYEYASLVEQNREIRLLSLKPGAFLDPIRLELCHEPLSTNDLTQFEALSYVWGSDKKKSRVYSSKGWILVTENLNNALKYLRYEDRPRMLWIDAICVNQENVQERSQQVAIMGDVYQFAKRVIVWLGPETDDSTFALEVLHSLGSEMHVDWQSDTLKPFADGSDPPKLLPYGERELTAIYDLFHRPWFERLWTRQEIRLANSDAIIICGRKIISWQAFRKAVFCLRLIPVKRELLFSKSESFYERMELIYLICDEIRVWPIEYMLIQSRMSECSDPRDRVFAMLGILHPADKAIGIVPDYSKETAEVYQNLVVRYINHYKDLHILSCCELKAVSPVMPSWVPDWTMKSLCEPLWTCGQGGDLLALACTAFQGPKILRSAGFACAIVESVQKINLRVLYSSPLIAEEIRKLAPRDIEGIYGTGGSFLEAYCRTLCCNEFGDRWVPPKAHFPYSSESVEFVASLLDQTGNSNDIALLGSGARRYLSSICKFCRGRSLFSTKEGYIGLGPKSTKPGDQVCTLFGRDTPLILRPFMQGAETKYQVIGECYTHGLMTGEALLGDLPENVEQVFLHNEISSGSRVFYRDTQSKRILGEDPRLTSLLIDMVKHHCLEDANLEELLRKDLVETLTAAGMKIKTFDLV